MHPYASMAYARSLSHWGEAFDVPPWRTPVILRGIAGGDVDAAGVYPFAVLPPDADIAGGLAHLRGRGVVSVVMVLDAFHRPAMEEIRPHAALITSFKTHYLYDPAKGEVVYDSHHRRALKKAQAAVRVAALDLKTGWESWQALYDYIIADMKLTGLHAFPAAHHAALAEIEGFTAIGAWVGGELVSAHVWAHDGGHAHSHLVASNAKGYECRAAYAVNDFSMQHFAGKKILNFGGGAGFAEDAHDGLARFKRGFSNTTAHSYLCGAILDPEKYEAFSAARGSVQNPGYFPAYRAP